MLVAWGACVWAPEAAPAAPSPRPAPGAAAPRVLGPDAAPVAQALASALGRALHARVVSTSVAAHAVRMEVRGGGWDGQASIVDGPSAMRGLASAPGQGRFVTRHGLLILPRGRPTPAGLVAALDAVAPSLPWRRPAGGATARREPGEPRPTPDAGAEEGGTVPPRVAAILARRGIAVSRAVVAAAWAPRPLSDALAAAAEGAGGVCDDACAWRAACLVLGPSSVGCDLPEDAPSARAQALAGLGERFPFDPKAWVLRGRAWAAAGRPGEALADLAVATSLDVPDADALAGWRAWTRGPVVVPADAPDAVLSPPPPLPPAPAGTQAPREGILTPPPALLRVETARCVLAPPRLTRSGWSLRGLCAGRPVEARITPVGEEGSCEARHGGAWAGQRTRAHCVGGDPTSGPESEGAAEAAAAVARVVRALEPDGFFAPRLPRRAAGASGGGSRAERRRGGRLGLWVAAGALGLGLAAAGMALRRRGRQARSPDGPRARPGA